LPTTATATTSAPTGDLPGWRLVLSEDFSAEAPLGSFAQNYRGWAGYDTWRDTSRSLGRPTVSQGVYNSATTTSVHAGVLDEFLHTDGQTPQVIALTPAFDGRSNSSQTYGRYAVRFRADTIPGYTLAWLLWPDSDDWAEGELDFPEGKPGGTIMGYAHDTTGNPSKNAWYADTGTTMTDWHTAVIEWTPTRLTYALDGRSWSTTNSTAIPTTPMHWVLQTETQLSSTAPDPTVSGHVQIDWLAAWQMA
jgi:hypothetical protein